MTHKVLLVGLGQVAMGYDEGAPVEAGVHTHTRAFSVHPSFALFGGVDPSVNRREVFQRSYGVPAWSSVDEALLHAVPDVVVIAAPTPHHAVILQDVLAKARPRAVLCEKPLSYSLQEAREMVENCASSGCALYVNYPRRSVPGSREVKARFDDGRIAGPLKGVGWYSKGLLHNGSHFVDLASYWLGPIAGFSVMNAGRLWDGVDPEPDVRLIFARGEVSFFAAREENYSLHEIDLVAANGRLRYTGGGQSIVWQPAVDDQYFVGYTVLDQVGESIETDAKRTQWHVADQLARGLDDEEAELCTGEQALITLEWLTKIRGAL